MHFGIKCFYTFIYIMRQLQYIDFFLLYVQCRIEWQILMIYLNQEHAYLASAYTLAHAWSSWSMIANGVWHSCFYNWALFQCRTCHPLCQTHVQINKQIKRTEPSSIMCVSGELTWRSIISILEPLPIIFSWTTDRRTQNIKLHCVTMMDKICNYIKLRHFLLIHKTLQQTISLSHTMPVLC